MIHSYIFLLIPLFLVVSHSFLPFCLSVFLYVFFLSSIVVLEVSQDCIIFSRKGSFEKKNMVRLAELLTFQKTTMVSSVNDVMMSHVVTGKII